MRVARPQALFENRLDAGRKLAVELADYQGRSTVVLGIPNGGVPVAVEVAMALKSDLGLVITRKIPNPLNPEAGFGAVVDDGTIIIDEDMARRLGLNKEQIDYQVNKVRAAIRQRSLLYHKDKPLISVAGKTVIIADDGLAAGLTMMAAVTSVRRRRPAEIIVAAPVASASAVERLEKVADKIVTCFTAQTPSFAVADYYRYWHDLSDDEVLRLLSDWRRRRMREG